MTNSIIALSLLIPILISCQKRTHSPPAFGQGRQLKIEEFPNVEDSIFGVWSGDQAEFGDELVFLTNYYFNQKGEVGVKRTCIGNGEEVEVSTVVSGTIGEQEVEIQSTAQVTAQGESISRCTLTVHAGLFLYNLSGNRLEFSGKSVAPRSFTRVEY